MLILFTFFQCMSSFYLLRFVHIVEMLLGLCECSEGECSKNEDFAIERNVMTEGCIYVL